MFLQTATAVDKTSSILIYLWESVGKLTNTENQSQNYHGWPGKLLPKDCGGITGGCTCWLWRLYFLFMLPISYLCVCYLVDH